MQFSNIYGPTNKTGNLISYTLNQLNNNLPATFGPADQPYDFIYIDDLLEAIYRLGIFKTSLNTYFIGSGTPRILKDYLITIGNFTNKLELIRLNSRSPDILKYTIEMFDISSLKQDIGIYISGSFEKFLDYTIKNYSEVELNAKV